MPRDGLEDISQAQRERLFHIDFKLRFLGEVSRADLVNRFGIKAAAATRDLSLYKEVAPGNLEYDTKAKIYTAATKFSPLFTCSQSQALSALSQGLGDDYLGTHQALISTDTPTQLNLPHLDKISAVSRAVYRGIPLQIDYRSLSSGVTQREIVPHALVDNGLRWHVRAYDRLRDKFSDFVINRISDVCPLVDAKFGSKETKDADIQWNRIVEMHLVPHPKLTHPETIEYEYGMQGGHLSVQVRAAVAGYVLRRWNVDCSAEHSLEGPEYHLWLSNQPTLYGVENLNLAPGYDSSATNLSAGRARRTMGKTTRDWGDVE